MRHSAETELVTDISLLAITADGLADSRIKDGRMRIDARYLKQLRRYRGLSQERLSDGCIDAGHYVSLSSIKRAEAGKCILYRTAGNLARYFNISVESLMGKDG